MVWGRNPISVITPYADTSFYEKYHTLTYNGNFSTVQADYAREQTKSLKDTNEAKDQWEARSFKLAYSVLQTKLNWMILESSQDVIHLDQMRNYINDCNESESVFNKTQGWLDHSNNASQALLDAKTL